VKPGDDLSYYLGPSATCATAEQCAELERAFKEAARAATALVRAAVVEECAKVCERRAETMRGAALRAAERREVRGQSLTADLCKEHEMAATSLALTLRALAVRAEEE